MPDLLWLPPVPDTWRADVKTLRDIDDAETFWLTVRVLARYRLDFVKTGMLDSMVKTVNAQGKLGHPSKPVRLAILSSCTTTHLQASIRVAGFRRGIEFEIYETNFGQYWQELADSSSPLHAFKPNVILMALDARHVAAGANVANSNVAVDLDSIEQQIKTCWTLARESFNCPVIQQTFLNPFSRLIGNNEHRLAGSPSSFISELNRRLPALADSEGVDLLDVAGMAAQDGMSAWYDEILWHRSKQEIALPAAPFFGDLFARLWAAKQGKSSKCLVLDLDNTLWGGVIGDDGMDGIVIGQGSALGEGFVNFQKYAQDLAKRGVILAVCSKNDEANALEPFEKHPEMVLKTNEIACFVANWTDKASNLKHIAAQLNIGLDSLVFVDDNPFERNLVRQELPMVEVPEVGDDPAHYAHIVASAGYFESPTITDEDRVRSVQYQENNQREAFKASATDLPSYLRSLQMELEWRPFDEVGLARVVQLINKTNQFNLTTRRYVEEDVLAFMSDPRAFGLQLRLVDRFGDNGIISIIIGKMENDEDLHVDTWLMSCRVLGRQVEPATLNLVVEQAKILGAQRIVGTYLPTKKNGMVKDHYRKLGFERLDEADDGANRNVLELDRFTPADTFIEIKQGH